MNKLLKQALERGVCLWVEHRCGHVVEWFLMLEETTMAEVKADLEMTECMACRKLVELDA